MANISDTISIYESEVVCLNSILELQESCNKENVVFSEETNKFLLNLTLKKVGPAVTQKVVSKLVEKGEIAWHETEDFEVEQILAYVEEDGKEFYLIKWKGWSKQHNSWEPKDNLECTDLLEEFHVKNFGGDTSANGGLKRKFNTVDSTDVESDRPAKRSRLDELFSKLVSAKNVPSPMEFMSMTSPNGKKKSYNGLVSCVNRRKHVKLNKSLSNPKTKAYKEKKKEILKALKDWEIQLNKECTDPAPITVENDVDLEGPPDNFNFINDYLSGPGIVIPDDPVIGCECEDCYKNKKGCCAAQSCSEFAYNKYKRSVLHSGRPIYECNKRCKCPPDCPNRVIQNGRKHKVCIFRTSNGRGWGVKAKQKIKAGTFVMEYVGEVISNDEAEKRGMTYDAVGRTYLFDLDFNGDDHPFCVDAAEYGNVSHFVNHSCDPNMEVFSAYINTLDPRLPRITMFARRDIEKDEELTFDYGSSKPHSGLEDDLDCELAVNEAGDAGADDDDDDSKSDDSGVSSSHSNANFNTNAHKSENSLMLDATSANSKTDSLSNDDMANLPVVEDSSNEPLLSTSTTEPLLGNGAIEPLPGTSATESVDGNAVMEPGSDGVATIPVAGPSQSSRVKESQPAQYRMFCQCGAKNCRKYVF